jgi:DNA-binding XRE family transcriptional regulator
MARNYQALHEEVLARPGAVERLGALRRETLIEIGLFELRRVLGRSQGELASELRVSQSAISQLEWADDVKLSTLRSYLERLGARLEILAVFEGDDDDVAVPIRVEGRTSG